MTRSEIRLAVWSAVAGAILCAMIALYTAETLFPLMHNKVDQGQELLSRMYFAACTTFGAIAGALAARRLGRKPPLN